MTLYHQQRNTHGKQRTGSSHVFEIAAHKFYSRCGKLLPKATDYPQIHRWRNKFKEFVQRQQCLMEN